MSGSAYLDNSTAAKPAEGAVGAMMPYLQDRWGVPHAPHQRGQRLYAPMEEALRSIYALLGASDDDDLVITSGGAEAVNHVIYGVYHEVTRQMGKNHFLTARTDEAPAIVATGHLEEFGCVAKMIDVDRHGLVTPEALVEALSPRTALLSLSWGCGLRGVIQDIKPLREICRERGVLFHLDATHVLGKLFFDLDEIDPDFVTFNGEQIHSVVGTGGVLIRARRRLPPFLRGGTEQASMRAGSLNMPGLVALGAAADEALAARDYLCTEIARLRDRLEKGICDRCPQARCFFVDRERLPHVSVIAFEGVANEAMAFALDRANVAVCVGGGSLQQVGMCLQASGVDETLAHCAVSYSLSRYTTEEEIDLAIEESCRAAERLALLSRNVSTGELAPI